MVHRPSERRGAKLKQKYKNLRNETDKQYHEVCFLEATVVTNYTETNDRNKFLTRRLSYEHQGTSCHIYWNLS